MVLVSQVVLQGVWDTYQQLIQNVPLLLKVDDLVGTGSFQHYHHDAGPAKIGVHDPSHHVISLDHVVSRVMMAIAVEKQGVGIVVYAQRIVA